MLSKPFWPEEAHGLWDMPHVAHSKGKGPEPKRGWVPAHLHLPFGAAIQQDEALGGSLEQSGFHRLWRGTSVSVYIPHHPQQGFEEHGEPARHSAEGNSNTNPLEPGESAASLSSSQVLQAGLLFAWSRIVAALRRATAPVMRLKKPLRSLCLSEGGHGPQTQRQPWSWATQGLLHSSATQRAEFRF